MKNYYHLMFLTIFTPALFVPSLCNGEEQAHSPVATKHSSITDLSPELRDLLSQEMRQLQTGMGKILPLYISGQWAEIAPIAKKMQDSYVLKQKLSTEQKHELHMKLSDEFIALDQQFHYLSGMLSHAAEMEKPELVGFYYAKMSETCFSCHTKFASHKFPALTANKQSHTH